MTDLAPLLPLPLALGGWIVAIIVLGVTLLVAVVAGLWLMGQYNGLVRMKEAVRSQWADVEALLKRRHDLIPNLVETVQGYARHESGTLEAVMQARASATSAGGVQETAQAESGLSGALGRLMAVAENYPDLKADGNFAQLQRELTSTEDGIARARQGYNNVVRENNTMVQSFPTNMIAGPFGFKQQDFFEVTTEAERETPQVSFS